MTEQDPPQLPRPQGKRDRSVGSPEAPSEAAVAPQPQSVPTQTAPTETRPAQTQPPAVTGRSVPRWVYLAIVAVPLLALIVYNLVEASGGGAVKIGETFTHDSGLGLTVTAPQQYATADASVVGPGEQAYQVIVAVNNKTDEVVPASAVAVTVMVNGAPATAIHPNGPLTQDIEPGVQLNMPFQFKVKSGTSGALQISVESPSEKPVYFSGTI